MTQKTKIIFAVCLIMLVFANFSQAALVTCGRSLPPNATQEQIKKNECTLPKLITTIKQVINFLLSYASLVSILFIVVSGIRMVLAGGNEERISAAKTTLTHAIFGFIIILVSFVLLNLIIGLLTGGGILNPGALIEAFSLVK